MQGQRFSDEELITLKTEFELHVEKENERWNRLERMILANSTATEKLANAIQRQTESTAGVVQLYSDLESAIRVGLRLHKFVIWLVGSGAAVSAVVLAVSKVIA